ncbi:alpha/beta fold hydrolase [Actinomarinicola tropica]|uniref:Alpha/beta fold hydrolase n=1 Tax=Actinomarinicola tropica TaxID=2789776 RepID=A0A5Q2RQK3_9ACTN|nr:alpha/beta hydrolase [Actinomarinicola tropica]QGG96841.1 alpha/beta fold hydrolase [Actinomarinicola tropica]
MTDATSGTVRTGRATNGPVELHYEAAGDPSDPALLMVSGLGSQCITFVDPLIERFVEAGFFTIRYDNRDVGLSSKFAEVRPDLGAVVAALKAGEEPPVPYLLSDMAADAAAVLDALEVEAAHVLGVSMGGMIVQTMAIERPERMLSLTSIMSTTGDRSVGRSTPEANALLMTPAGPSRDEAVERMILGARTYGSPDHIDEERLAEIAGAAYDRCFHPEGTARQLMAITASGDRTEKLRGVTVPALVIHGDQDNLIDVSGGVATADAIPGASLAVLEGMGHDLPPAYWDRLVDLVTEHAARAAGS